MIEICHPQFSAISILVAAHLFLVLLKMVLEIKTITVKSNGAHNRVVIICTLNGVRCDLYLCGTCVRDSELRFCDGTTKVERNTEETCEHAADNTFVHPSHLTECTDKW